MQITPDNYRSHSEAQEAAQLLGGVHMPSTILSALVEASNLQRCSTISKPKTLERQDVSGLSSSSRVAVVNLTPYDGALEKACLKSAVECGPRTAFLDLQVWQPFSFETFSFAPGTEEAHKREIARMPSYSYGEDHLTVKYCERMVAQYLLEASNSDVW